MEDILIAIPKPVVIADYAREESGWIFGGPEDDVTQKREKIDLQPLIDRDLLTVASLNSETEVDSFVNFAVSLDDGEAATGAIAVHRQWAIATDDNKATRFFNREAPQLQIISTLGLIKYWADTTFPSPDAVCTTLQNVWLRARYQPSNRHPLFGWWQKHCNILDE